MHHTPRFRTIFTLLGLAWGCLMTTPAFAVGAADKPLIKETVGLDGIQWQTQTAYKSANLVVTGPGDLRMEQTFAPADTLFLDFATVAKSASPSGQYSYQLTFSPLLKAADKALAEEARALGEDVSFLAQKSIPTVSGTFTLADGNAVDSSLPEATRKVFFHTTAGSIDGSLCVGNDCVSSESFGFDTVRLKENNLRVHFDDTSSTASFPDNDWRITINDSSNGGAEYFAVEDASAGRQVFKLAAGAPTNALTVDSQGDVGIGTLNPAIDLQVVRGDTPTLRLEQNGTSGFTPQTWDVAGNETNFFIRDATGGSTLPFRIEPGTATNTLVLDSAERVGIKTNSPVATLDVRGEVDVSTTGAVGLDLGGTAGVAFRLDAGNEGTDFWQVTSTASDAILRFNRTGGGNEMEIKSNGNLTVSGTCFGINGNACTVSAGTLSCSAGACP